MYSNWISFLKKKNYKTNKQTYCEIQLNVRLAFFRCVLFDSLLSDAIESQLMLMLQSWHADDKSIKNYARITIFYATFAFCNVFNSWLLVANERIHWKTYDNI